MPSIDERIGLLRTVWLFSGCSDEELGHIAAIVESRAAAAGTEIIRQGEPGTEFFVMIAGTAEARADGDLIEEMGPGAFFGEISLLDAGERLATVTAMSDVDLLVLDKVHFNEMLEAAMPSVTPKLLQVVGERMRALAVHEGKPDIGY